MSQVTDVGGAGGRRDEWTREEADYAFVGDDGLPLPPEEATSLRMHADVVAAQRVRSLAPTDANDDSDDGGMCVAQSGAWYDDAQAHADAFLRSIGGAAALDAEAARLFAREATGATDCADEAVLALPDGATAVVTFRDSDDADTADLSAGQATSSYDMLPHSSAETLPMQEAPSGDAEGADNEDGMTMGGGSGGALDGYSREYSDGGEWQLERILAMRSVRRPERRREFLCQWRWYAEPTWEPESALVDLGFDVELARYLAAARAAPLAATQSADAVAGDMVAGGASSRNTGTAMAKFASPAKPRLTGELRSTIFERIFPDWFTFIGEQLRACDGVPTAVANIAPVHATARFLELWRRDHANFAPVRVFHGTRAPIVPAICVNGLAVPGSMGVTVRNGQAYGPGIYTARTPRTPMGYTDQYNFMFVCVALLGSTYVRAGDGSVSHDRYLPRQFVIFSENFYVVPVWLVQFRRLEEDNYDERYRLRTAQEMHRIRAAELATAGAAVPPGVRVFPNWRSMLDGCLPIEKSRGRISRVTDLTADPTEHVDNSVPSEVSALRAAVTRAAEVIRAAGAPPSTVGAAAAVEVGAQTAAQVRAVRRYGRASDGKLTKRMLKQVPRSVRDAFV